ncbi:transposase [Cytophaga hutchinsonii]|nr:transposase [Cytophaga hutchinsonii]
MKCIFGEIKNGSMLANQYGKIAGDAWLQTMEIRTNVRLHAFVIMPNHIHGIIEINTSRGELHSPAQEHSPAPTKQTPVPEQQQQKQQRGTSNTVGAIVRGYKASVTRQIKLIDDTIETVWHRNYYEHIIRDERSYENITNYINNNPEKWQADKFHRTGE